MMPDGVGPIDRAGEISLVLTTVPNESVGETIVRTLVEERLIACGNLIPGVTSVYRWQGKIARESELLVVMKVASAAVEEVFDRVAKLHPYSVPELVTLSVEGVSHAYGGWIRENSKVSHEGKEGR
jgi:periplasmic divalent cation tolerance protein